MSSLAFWDCVLSTSDRLWERLQKFLKGLSKIGYSAKKEYIIRYKWKQTFQKNYKIDSYFHKFVPSKNIALSYSSLLNTTYWPDKLLQRGMLYISPSWCRFFLIWSVDRSFRKSNSSACLLPDDSTNSHSSTDSSSSMSLAASEFSEERYFSRSLRLTPWLNLSSARSAFSC